MGGWGSTINEVGLQMCGCLQDIELESKRCNAVCFGGTQGEGAALTSYAPGQTFSALKSIMCGWNRGCNRCGGRGSLGAIYGSTSARKKGLVGGGRRGRCTGRGASLTPARFLG